MKVVISEITATKRRQLVQEKIQELAESIEQIGLLQPVLITPDKMLIAGLHRLEACKRLGW